MVRYLVLLAVLFSSSLFAMQVVSDKPTPTCEILRNKRPIALYQDPGLFLPDFSMLMYFESKDLDDYFKNKPLRRQLRINEPVMKLGDAFELHDDFYKVLTEQSKNWLKDARKTGPLRLIKVITCGEAGDPYSNEPGFIREDELLASLKDAKDDGKTGMPPSIYPNDVPLYIPNN